MLRKFFGSGYGLSFSVLAGILLLAGFIQYHDLQKLIHKGNIAKEADQMVDTMRRPFLAINSFRNHLSENLNPRSISSQLVKAINRAKTLLIQYQSIASYNLEISKSVAELSMEFDKWTNAEKACWLCMNTGISTSHLKAISTILLLKV